MRSPLKPTCTAGQPCHFDTLASLWYERGFSFLHYASEAATKGIASTPPRNTLQVLYRGALTRLVQPSCVPGSSIPHATRPQQPEVDSSAQVSPGKHISTPVDSAAACGADDCADHAPQQPHNGAVAMSGQPERDTAVPQCLDCAHEMPEAQAGPHSPERPNMRSEHHPAERQQIPQDHNSPSRLQADAVGAEATHADQPATVAAHPFPAHRTSAERSEGLEEVHARPASSEPIAENVAPDQQDLRESQAVLARAAEEASCDPHVPCGAAGSNQVVPAGRPIVDLTTETTHPFVCQVRRKHLGLRAPAAEPSHQATQRRTPPHTPLLAIV